MNLKLVFNWFFQKLSDYNLFIREDDDYDDDDENENAIRDPVVILRLQKYKTWLYVLVLSVSLVTLFYVTIMKMHAETIIISNITPDIYNQLYLKHGEKLSCACTNITVPYHQFVSNTISIHPVCDSIFVSKEWIERLYFLNASRYGVWDFRTTAKSQFELLSSFCLLSRQIVSQIQINIHNTELITAYLHHELTVQEEIHGTIEFLKTSEINRFMSFLNYLRTIIKEQRMVSALNTNYITFIQLDSTAHSSIFAYQIYHPTGNNQNTSCDLNSTVIAATLSPLSIDDSDILRRVQMIPLPNSTTVNGFFAGFRVFDAFLASTLDCLYSEECIQLLRSYFPRLHQMNVSWKDSILSSKHDNIDYTEYFYRCFPSICTYVRVGQASLSSTTTLLISLYGGLVLIFRLASSFFIDIVFKFKQQSLRRGRNEEHRRTKLSTFLRKLKQQNLFKNVNNRSESSIKEQRLISRAYLTLLIGVICALILFMSFNREMVTITERSPSLQTYIDLEQSHSTILRCPCSESAILYQKFLTLSPRLHQVCTSIFVEDDWIELLMSLMDYRSLKDWRNRASSEFRILSDFCQLANRTISDAVNRYLSQFFITSSILSKTDFEQQINASLKQFYQSTFYHFNSMEKIVHLLMQIDQPFVKSNWATVQTVDNGLVIESTTNDRRAAQIQFVLNEISTINSNKISCVCAVNSKCQAPAMTNIDYENFGTGLNFNITGWVEGCFSIDSIRFSSLQCFYVESNCFQSLLAVLGRKDIAHSKFGRLSRSFRPLVHYSITNYPPNTTVSIILDSLLLEQWNALLSYERFYEICAPSFCTYSIHMRKSFVEVITVLLSVIGGIVVSLRLLTPHLVKSVAKLATLPCKKKRTKPERSRRNRIEQLRMIVRNMFRLLFTALVNLNIFLVRDFGSQIDRATAVRYGRMATRAYLALVISTIAILAFQTILEARTVTKIFENPSLSFYKKLKRIYGNELKCPCSVIASTYDHFVAIEPKFHLIFSREFISDEWIAGITSELASNLSIYSRKDYRRFLSAHLHYLQGLCHLSQQSIENSINQFLSSLLVTNELLSAEVFSTRLDILIEQTKLYAPILLKRLLFLVRNVNHANAFISTYGTNFQYTFLENTDELRYAPIVPLTYDNSCSCGLHSNCTTQAKFIEANSGAEISIKGLKMGCTPSESLLLSSLECFYSQSCLDRIRQFTKYKYPIAPLPALSSRFPINTTVNELLSDLFIEEWSIDKNYSSYYHALLVFLGLQGGLSIVLNWICPKLIRIGMAIYQYRKRRTNSVSPSNTNVTNNHLEATPTNIIAETTSTQKFFKTIIAQILLITLIFVLITATVYFMGREGSPMDVLNSTNSETTTSTSMPISSFVRAHKKITATVGYINADNQIDIIFFCEDTAQLNILLSNGDGTFQKAIEFAVNDYKWMIDISVGDFNNDKSSDVVLRIQSESVGRLIILFGNNNGTFQEQTVLPWTTDSTAVATHVSDFNRDNVSDIAINSPYRHIVQVFFGSVGGSISSPMILSTGDASEPRLLAIGDLNNDGYFDIAVYNLNYLHITVFFGQTNGSFLPSKAFFTGMYLAHVFNLVIGDFNNDSLSDLALISSNEEHTVVEIYRYENDTFQSKQKINIESIKRAASAIVTDLNGDNRSDIVIGTSSPYAIYGLLGYGNDEFYLHTIYSSIHTGYYIHLIGNYFNNDTCADVISVNDVSHSIDFFLSKRCGCLSD
ncbi:unnamed protein product [Adineta ricciae]|uniref:Uncharacterized protein n=1 Tax=Adineta ricciae TaxID=249248 RepID=A0A815QVQ1_ADIRI|nr:unnamed protein product [Adineta ricciae]